MKDEWVRAAMIDDTVVVELLIHLKQQAAAGPVKPQAVIPFRWGLRLARSKQTTSSSVVVSRRKDGDSSSFTRCSSPTTPLLWSGGGGAASPSATVDGFEETSSHICCSGVRSKVSAVGETASISNKRSRRKKTFFELKQEESVLLLEKLNLKEELATLNANLKEQRAKKENLKRIKLDLNVQCGKNTNIASCEVEKASCSQTHRSETSSLNQISPLLPMHFKADDDDSDDDTVSDSSGTQDAESNHDRSSFLLPDLNAMPSDEDQNTEAFS